MGYFRHREDPGRVRCSNAAAVVVLAGCLVGIVSTQAADGHWTMATVDGVAMVIVEGNEGQAATQGYPLVAGATLVTGGDGTVTLVRRGDSVKVYPNSEVTIPQSSDSGRLGVMQSLGELLFRMETRESRNFEVRTPFLAATVKGTVFTVQVAADRATVTVAEGSVLVAPVRGGRSQLIAAGNRASVNAASANQVDVDTISTGQPATGNRGRGRGQPPDGVARDAQSSNGGSQGDNSQDDNGQGGDAPGNESPSNESPGNGGSGGRR